MINKIKKILDTGLERLFNAPKLYDVPLDVVKQLLENNDINYYANDKTELFLHLANVYNNYDYSQLTGTIKSLLDITKKDMEWKNSETVAEHAIDTFFENNFTIFENEDDTDFITVNDDVLQHTLKDIMNLSEDDIINEAFEGYKKEVNPEMTMTKFKEFVKNHSIAIFTNHEEVLEHYVDEVTVDDLKDILNNKDDTGWELIRNTILDDISIVETKNTITLLF